jgi:hypothetical protein
MRLLDKAARWLFAWCGLFPGLKVYTQYPSVKLKAIKLRDRLVRHTSARHQLNTEPKSTKAMANFDQFISVLKVIIILHFLLIHFYIANFSINPTRSNPLNELHLKIGSLSEKTITPCSNT